ncbi:hypothetical protein FOZ63_014483, partial [Perkinsus olseni]
NGSLTSSRVAPTDWLMIMPTRSITDYVVEAGKFWETQRLNTYWQRMKSEERDMARRNQAISKIRARIEEARKELRSLKQELDSSRATNLQLEKRLSTGSADALRDAREFEVDDFDLAFDIGFSLSPVVAGAAAWTEPVTFDTSGCVWCFSRSYT